MWYYPLDTLNKQRLFNFELGARGCGKTTGAIRFIIDQHLKDPSYEAVWTRRFKEERNEIERTFFDGIVAKNFYPNHKFKLQSHIGYMDDKPLVRFSALSVDKRRKGITSPNVRLIVFDEFLVDKGDRYLVDEFNAFLSFYDTIARPNDPDRKRVPVLFMANAMSMNNPYFNNFNISFNENGQFKTKRIFAEIIADDEFYEASKKSEFADAIKGTSYLEHSIKNEFLLDNMNFISEKTRESRCICNLAYESDTIGVWVDWREGKIWLSRKYDPSCKFKYAMGAIESPNVLSAKYFKRSMFYKYIECAYNTGMMNYEDIQVKAAWQKLVRAISI